MKPYSLTPGEDSTVTYSSGVDANGNAVADNGFAPEQDQPHKWGASALSGTPGGTVTFNYSGGWTTAQRVQIAAGLALWSDVADIQFTQVDDSAASALTFVDDTSPASVHDGAFTIDNEQGNAKFGTRTLGAVTDGATSIQTTVYGWRNVASFTADAGYGVTTTVHEEGHALGLAHTGDYNAVAGNVQSYPQRNAFDSQQWSIMSYVEPSNPASAFHDQSGVAGTNWLGGTPQTWMPLDIVAAQRLYGVAATTPLSGGQVFGFHCNVQGASAVFFDFTRNAAPIVTLWDAGTGNTLDLSGFASPSVVDLRPGLFSSAGGLTNNIGIGFGVAIDTAIGGVGNDQFTVNDDSDHIVGGGGGDTVTFATAGGRWHETDGGTTRIWGGPAVSDQLDGIQHVRFTGGADTIATAGTTDDVTVSGGANDVYLASGSASVLSGGGNTILAAAGSAIVHTTAAGGAPGNVVIGDVVFGDAGAVLAFTGDAATDTIVAAVGAIRGGAGGVLAFGRGTGSLLDLVSSAGTSTVVGDPGGSVTVQGANGGVFVGGGGGSDSIAIGNGFGVAFAGGDKDTLVSSSAAGGYLIGSTGSEDLFADQGGGQQVIYAGSGNDTLRGGTGSNVIAAGSGAATATGGTGATLYEAQNGQAGGSLTIADWNPAADYLGLYGYAPGADQAAIASARPDGAGGTTITLADQTRITFVGVTSLDPTHFV